MTRRDVGWRTWYYWIVAAAFALASAFAYRLRRRATESFAPAHFPVYVIALMREPRRLQTFRNSYDLDSQPIVVEAVDGTQLPEPERLVQEGTLTAAGAESIRIGPPRRNADDLVTRGALGCYLSHVDVWKRATHSPFSVVFEDDADARIASRDIERRIARLPADWHVYLVGTPHTRLKATQTGSPGLERIEQFCGTHAYAISRSGALWLAEHGDLLPVDMQVDAKLASLTLRGLNVYFHKDEKSLGTTGVGTTVQSG